MWDGPEVPGKWSVLVNRIAAAIVFAVCIGWIAADCITTGHAHQEISQWTFFAVIGAIFSFFKVIEDD